VKSFSTKQVWVLLWILFVCIFRICGHKCRWTLFDVERCIRWNVHRFGVRLQLRSDFYAEQLKLHGQAMVVDECLQTINYSFHSIF
jgi:hypothetical protein